MWQKFLTILLALGCVLWFSPVLNAQQTPCEDIQAITAYNLTRENVTTAIGTVNDTYFKEQMRAQQGNIGLNCQLTNDQLGLMDAAIAYSRSQNITYLPTLISGTISTPAFTKIAPTNSSAPVSANSTTSQVDPCRNVSSTGQPIDDTASCGGANADGSPQICCSSKLGSLNPCAEISGKTQEFLCVDILWGKICLSDFMNKIKQGADTLILGDDGGGREGSSLKQIDSYLGSCDNGYIRDINPDGERAQCTCVPSNGGVGISERFCTTYLVSAHNIKTVADFENFKKNPEMEHCLDCFAQTGYWSSIGCIHLNSLQDFIQKNLFGWGLGLASFIAIGLISFAAVQIQLSQGNPEKLKKAQELLTSAIIGFMLILFSIFILRLIGVTILQIPGFS